MLDVKLCLSTNTEYRHIRIYENNIILTYSRGQINIFNTKR